MAVQHREVHRQTLLIQAHGHPPRVAALHLVDQGLQFDQQRAGSLPGNGGDAARRVDVAALQEYGRRVGNGLHALFGHGENAQFVDRAEPVLHAAQGSKTAATRAVQHEEAVDHVFQHLGPRQVALLGDMPHQHHHGTGLLGEPREVRCRLAHLADTARRTLDTLQLQNLHRIEHQKRRFPLFDEPGDDLGTGFRGNLQLPAVQAEPLRTQRKLLQRLLAGHVEHRCPRCNAGANLQQQRTLARPRIAPDQYDRPRNQPTAEYPVEFTETRPEAVGLFRPHLAQVHDLRGAPAVAHRRLVPGTDRQPGQHVPLAADAAPPLPLGMFGAAIGAHIDRLRFSHRLDRAGFQGTGPNGVPQPS